MKKFIKQRLREDLIYNHVVGDATEDEFKITEYWEEETDSPLANELKDLNMKNLSPEYLEIELKDIEARYAEKYEDFPGDTYGIIDAINKVIPKNLSRIYNDLHPRVRYEQMLRKALLESEDELYSDLRFNDGKFNKQGPNTIYMGDNPIVDFGVGGIGNMEINGETIPNALYLKGGYNASEQRKGYGGLGLKFIFHKLPKIQNIVLQCYDTACPFWIKQGGKEIAVKEMPGGHSLRTLRIARDSFY